MAKQFLTFIIENTTYAFEVERVQEVLEYSQPVKIPCSVEYIEGLINSRNQGITLINLRRRFGQAPGLCPVLALDRRRIQDKAKGDRCRAENHRQKQDRVEGPCPQRIVHPLPHIHLPN